jgi:gentisate 1,2-dioxygenase
MDHSDGDPSGLSASPSTGANAVAYASRARFLSVEDGFNIQRAVLRPDVFLTERDRAFDDAAPTGLIHLDRSSMLGLPFPATSPWLLASYIILRRGDQLESGLRASGEIYVALRGAGWTAKGSDHIAWATGDIFCLPGGEAATIHHADSDAVLYVVSDDPALRFEGAGALRTGEAAIEAVLYPRSVTQARLAELKARLLPPHAPGRALNLSSRAMEHLKTCLPTLTLTFNLVGPGDQQRPHRHNAAALVLVLEQGACQSVVGGRRLDWSKNAVVLTPAGEVHTHANAADGPWALALIVQDGGLHYHCRTMGFAFA